MTELILTNRLYKYIKSSAIVNLIQANVELITNSDDAYRDSGLPTPHHMDIVVDYKNRMLKVYDQAIGLDSKCMIKCFGQVGDYTSQIENRGYFSRGAKDITAIGDATFVGIKDGKISEVTLTTTDIFTVIRSDDPVQDSDREKYGITNNGVYNQLKVKDSIVFPEYEEIKNISKYFSLRDIFSNTDNFIKLTLVDENEVVIFSDRLTYTPLKYKEKLIDEEFIVDGYSAIKAKFELYLLEEPLDVVEYGSYMEHGILVSSGNAIHEVSTLYNDIRSHPYIRYIFGRLHCDHINQLMYDFENNPDNVANPHPVIDHSRLNGLDRSHPFTKALYRIPHQQIKYVLQDLYENEVVDSKFSEDISSLFKDIEIFGKDFFREMVQAIYPYKYIDVDKITNYLSRRVDNIITSDSDSKFDFSNPKSFIKTNNDGKFQSTEPTFNIIFTDKDYLDFCYSIYRIDNKIILEINIKDFYVSKYIKRSLETNEIVFINKIGAQVLLVNIITEAMARESIREKNDNTQSNSNNYMSSEDIFTEFEKIRSLLLPKIYDIIIKEDLKGITMI
jgi:hypothetical protein